MHKTTIVKTYTFLQNLITDVETLEGENLQVSNYVEDFKNLLGEIDSGLLNKVQAMENYQDMNFTQETLQLVEDYKDSIN